MEAWLQALVSNVLVWTKAPFLVRNKLVVAEAMVNQARAALPGEVKHLGKRPMTVPVSAESGSRLEVTVAEVGQDWVRKTPATADSPPDNTAA